MKIIKPKGTLIPIGGGGDGKDILKRIVKETGKRKANICYITVATSSLAEARQNHKNFIRDMGQNNVSVIHFNSHNEADTDENLEKIKKCNAVLIGGGNQLRLGSLMGGTALMTEIKRRYYDEADFVISGSSAGATAMSAAMILSGSSEDALVKGELQLTNGLNLISNMVIDTHFTERGRFGRLIQTVAYNPGVLGLGLSANTAAVISKGEKLEVIGAGFAVIVDGTLIEYSNLTEVSDGEPITVEGLKMHILGPENFFLINERKIKAMKIKKD